MKQINFHFEPVIVAFANLKMKQTAALEDLDQTNTRSEFIGYVGNLELNGPGWFYTRRPNISIHLYKGETRNGIDQLNYQ